jgi:DNA polymerase-3 subunit alpha
MHPLKEVREALVARCDRPLGELSKCKDGDWVTAGGIITACKKLRTKKGDPMMFATLDDLEGQVELIVFGNALAEYDGVLDVDSVVLVRGRVDNGERGTSLIVQTVEKFDPSHEEVEAARTAAALAAKGPEPMMLILDAASLPASIIDELKHVFGNHLGAAEVVLDIRTSQGPRTLRLGPDFRVDPTPSLRAELARILGPEALAAKAVAASG